MIDGCLKHKDFKKNKNTCIDCKRAYYSWNAQKDRKRVGELINNYKLSKGCAHCGYNENVFALEFDHIKPREDTTKKWQSPKWRKQAIDIINDPNIQVLCANCHRIKTRMNNDHMARPATTIGDKN